MADVTAEGRTDKVRSRKDGTAAPIDDVDRKLLNLMQGSFPLELKPFAAVAALAELTEAEVMARVRRLLDDRIVLVTAHGNSLRALVKHLDGLGEDEVVGLNIPTGIPLVYDLDDDMKPTTRGGRYLDPAAAEAAIAAVANQGR